jgi:uncharacterized protein DUF5367
MRVVVAAGFALWLLGTVLLRSAGHWWLPRDSAPAWVFLYLVSGVATSLIARAVYRRAGIPRQAWLSAASAFILPTLLLDAFTALFFASAFPQLDVRMSGAFGGWMLICSAGAVVGAWVRP